MFCSKCGSNIPKGYRFCSNCGAKVDIVVSDPITTKEDAGKELMKANQAAADVVQAANAEAIKVAKEFSESVAKENKEDREKRENIGKIEKNENIGKIEKKENEKNTEKKEKSPETSPETAQGVAALPMIQKEQPVEKDSSDTPMLPTESKAGSEVPAVKNDADKNGQLVQSFNPIPQDGIKNGKKIPPALIIIIAAGLVLGVIALVFMLSDTARNGLKKAFSSDASYFRSVESKAIESLVDDLSIAYEDDILAFFDLYKSEYELKVDVDVKDEAEAVLDALFENNRELDLEWIKKANLTADLSVKDNKVGVEGELSVNKEKLFDLSFISDSDEDKIYLNFPILSKKYAMFNTSVSDTGVLDSVTKGSSANNIIGSLFGGSLPSISSFEAIKDALPSKKELKKIVNRYVDIALKEIDRVKTYEEESLEACGVKDKYFMIKVSLDEETQRNIMTALIEELVKDDDVLAIISRMERSGKFGDTISAGGFLDMIEAYKEKLDTQTYKFMTLKVWVDESGDVVAQELVDDTDTGYLYKYVINEGNFGFEAYEKKKGSMKDYINISGTISGTVISGKFRAGSKGYDNISINFTDIDVKKLLRGNPEGKIKLNAYELTKNRVFRDMDIDVVFDLGVKNAEVDFILSEDGKTLIDIDLLLDRSSASKVKIPKDSEILDTSKSSELGEWVSGFNWKTMLENAEDAEMPSTYYKRLEKLSEDFVGTLSNSSLLGSVAYLNRSKSAKDRMNYDTLVEAALAVMADQRAYNEVSENGEITITLSDAGVSFQRDGTELDESNPFVSALTDQLGSDWNKMKLSAAGAEACKITVRSNGKVERTIEPKEDE